MSPFIRTMLLFESIVFAGVGVWQYFGYRESVDNNLHFWIAIICLAISMGSLLIFFLTKPKEDISDVSITKF